MLRKKRTPLSKVIPHIVLYAIKWLARLIAFLFVCLYRLLTHSLYAYTPLLKASLWLFWQLRWHVINQNSVPISHTL